MWHGWFSLMTSFFLVLLVARTSALTADVGSLAREIYGRPSPPQLVVYLTGGGAQLVPMLLTTPGASRSVLELRVPYAQRALKDLLGAEPTRYCVPDVARSLALAAYERAQELSSEEGAPCMGVGCTAALRSTPERRGQHRCYIAVATDEGVHELELMLTKGVRERAEEDEVVSRCMLLGLAKVCGLDVAFDVTPWREFWSLAAGPSDEIDPAMVASLATEELKHRFRMRSELEAAAA